jgi:hypothetical protein
MKVESIGGTKNKMAVSEATGSTKGTFRKEGCDFATGSLKQGAAARRKLNDLSAGGDAKQQNPKTNAKH